MNLNEIKEALSKATPGPWADNVFEPYTDVHSYNRLTEEPDGLIAKCTNEADAHLLSNAPEWLASLVAEVEELREMNFGIIKTADVIDARNQALLKQLEEAKKTLEWYADEAEETARKFYFGTVPSNIGERARQTLQSLKGAHNE